MKLKPTERIPLHTAKHRALDCLPLLFPVPAHMVADHVWPSHSMKPQGAGAAASRILKVLEKEGLAKWTSDGRYWGWIRTKV